MRNKWALSIAPAGLIAAFVIYLGKVHWENPKENVPRLAAENNLNVFGRRIYLQKCASCHHGDGQGAPEDAPPLAGTELVQGAENHLVRIVLNGLTGPVTVHGIAYNGAMPAWKNDLNDDECAALLTYLRQAWGNQASPISASQITALRAEIDERFTPWTIAELRMIPSAPRPTVRPHP
jgi:mono/diheme cytochrome c family protein